MYHKMWKDKDEFDYYYRQIHAMCAKGYSNDEIVRSMSLPEYKTLDIIQTIDGKLRSKNERRERVY